MIALGSLGEAWRAVLRRPLRSLPAALGVILGVATLIAAAALGATAQSLASPSCASLGFYFAFAVAGVSFLVGGVGIMNRLSVSVAESAREICVRVAVGAQPRDILVQFLVEALLLALCGAALGVALGLGVAHWIAAHFHGPFALPGRAILVAVAAAALLGLLFGILPARRASRLDPIDTWRHP